MYIFNLFIVLISTKWTSYTFAVPLYPVRVNMSLTNTVIAYALVHTYLIFYNPSLDR